MNIFKTIENEIRDYTQGLVEISPGDSFSQFKLIKRIMMFLSNKYSSGNIDSQGNYKYWYDIIAPRVDTEIKNIDFDTKDIVITSDAPVKDSTQVYLANLELGNWMKNNDHASKLNDAVEDGSAYGNVVWKKTKESYEKVKPINLYVINQIAETLKDSPVIERHILSQSQLRAKKGIWDADAVDNVIKSCKMSGLRSSEEEVLDEDKETPYYEIYERNGEIDMETLNQAMNKPVKEGDCDRFVLAKIIVAGINHKRGTDKKGEKYILFAEDIKEMPYKEYHRGKYEGRWWRRGVVELLFDIQIRANQIGNEIARALEFGGKQVFNTQDQLIYKNILTDLQRGDIVRGDIKRIDMSMHDISNYINEWNLLMEQADKITNTFDVSRGENMPSGTPFRSTALLNVNANKFYDFIREKLGIAIKSIMEDWELPRMIKELKKKDLIKLTGNEDYLDRLRDIFVQAWYIKNLVAFGSHSDDQAKMLKELKKEELKKNIGLMIKMQKTLFDGFIPRAKVIITGESINLQSELQTLSSLASMETDPIRRTALIEEIAGLATKRIDVSMLPKTEQQPLQPQQQQMGRQQRQPMAQQIPAGRAEQQV